MCMRLLSSLEDGEGPLIDRAMANRILRCGTDAAADPASGARDGVDPGTGEFALAFDHAEILGAAVKRLRGKLDYAALGFQLLPDRFTLRDLQTVHETILGRELNKDSFRRRMLATGLIEPTGEREQNVLHRPAELYRIHQASAV